MRWPDGEGGGQTDNFHIVPRLRMNEFTWQRPYDFVVCAGKTMP